MTAEECWEQAEGGVEAETSAHLKCRDLKPARLSLLYFDLYCLYHIIWPEEGLNSVLIKDYLLRNIHTRLEQRLEGETLQLETCLFNFKKA